MTRPAKLVSCLLMVAALLALTGSDGDRSALDATGNLSCTPASYTALDEILHDQLFVADAVVLAIIEAERPAPAGSALSARASAVEARLLHVFAGMLSADTLSIPVTGYVSDLNCAGAPRFADGEVVLLFLERAAGAWRIALFGQGAFRLTVDGAILAQPGSEVANQPLSTTVANLLQLVATATDGRFSDALSALPGELPSPSGLPATGSGGLAAAKN